MERFGKFDSVTCQTRAPCHYSQPTKNKKKLRSDLISNTSLYREIVSQQQDQGFIWLVIPTVAKLGATQVPV